METVPFERVLGKEVGAGFLKGLTVKGIDFEMQAGVDSFVPSSACSCSTSSAPSLAPADTYALSLSAEDDSSRVGGVKLKSGVVLDADVVVLGTGAAPNTQLLEQAGVALEDDRSVKVNGFLQLDGHPDVYALGDIATYPFRGTSTRIEHWNVAANHGRAAAAHIAGDEAAKHPFDKTPIFWSALGSQLRYSGNGKGFAEVHVDGEPSEFKFAAYYADEAGEVIASASMGRDRASPSSSPHPARLATPIDLWPTSPFFVRLSSPQLAGRRAPVARQDADPGRDQGRQVAPRDRALGRLTRPPARRPEVEALTPARTTQPPPAPFHCLASPFLLYPSSVRSARVRVRSVQRRKCHGSKSG